MPMLTMGELLDHQGRSPVLLRDVCLACGHPIIAQSQAALDRAHLEHIDYAIRIMSRADDPHFEDTRLDQLVQA